MDTLEPGLTRRQRADAELEAFGYDPRQMEQFLKRSPSERLDWALRTARFIAEGRLELSRGRIQSA